MPIRSRALICVVELFVMICVSLALANESLSLPAATAIDQLSTGQISNSPDAHVDDEHYDGLLGTRQHWFGPSITSDDDDDDDESYEQKIIEKRKPKLAGFRSDLGKRMQDEEDEYLDKRAYKTRGGKAFKADLGKRAARGGSSMFRSDLGKRFDSLGKDFDTDELADNEEDDMIHIQRRGSMFRSDLGKRPAKPEAVRRMFKADLGKRRTQFRHDLG